MLRKLSKRVENNLKTWYNVSILYGEKFMKKIKIITEYITLGQLLKLVGEISQGSDVKEFLITQKVLVNSQKEERRGKKLRPHDEVVVGAHIYIIE